MTQTDLNVEAEENQILKYLQTGKDLPKDQAMELFNISPDQVRTRIKELNKREGVEIKNQSIGNAPAVFRLVSNGQAKQKPKPQPKAEEVTYPKMIRVNKDTNRAIKLLALESDLTQGEIILEVVNRGIIALNKEYGI